MAIYKLDFCANNALLTNYIEYIIKTTQIDGIVTQTKDSIYIKLLDSEENNYYFLNHLQDRLPMCMYAGEFVEYKEYIKTQEIQHNQAFVNLSLSYESISAIFTPNTTNYYNPFITHSFFGRNYSFINTAHIEDYTIFKHHHLKELYIQKNDKTYLVDDNKKLFANLAQELKHNKIISIKTCFETRTFALNTKENREKLKNYTVFVSSQYVLYHLFDVSDYELKVINSIQRPKVRLKLNQPIDNKDYIFAKLPDDGFCYLLSYELKLLDIEELIYTTDDLAYDTKLYYDEEINIQKDFSIYCIDQKSFVLDSQRVVLPKIARGLDKSIFYFANDLCALRIDKNKYLINHKGQFVDIKIDLQKAKLLNRDFFDYEACIYSIIAENHISSPDTINIYLSKNSYNSSISILQNNQIKQLLKIPPIDNNLKNHLNISSDYISSYKYPLDVLLDFVSHILDIEYYDFDYIDASGEIFCISTLMIDDILYFDYRDVLEYVLNTKETKDKNEILASVYISIAHYIYKECTKLDKKDILICGDMFYNKIFTKAFYEVFCEYQIYKNIEFPMDKQNQIFGAINIP